MDMGLVGTVERTEIRTDDTVGVVFEPAKGSNQFAVFLGGSFGGIPEAPARKLAENGVNAFALGYFGYPGLPAGLVEIPLEALQQGIELFRDGYARNNPIGVMGSGREQSSPSCSRPRWATQSTGRSPWRRRMLSGSG